MNALNRKKSRRSRVSKPRYKRLDIRANTIYVEIIPSHKKHSVVTCIGGGGLPRRKIIIISRSKDGVQSKKVFKVRKSKELGQRGNPWSKL